MLSEALPYLQKFSGKTFVVKYGGAAMKDKSLKVTIIHLKLLNIKNNNKDGRNKGHSIIIISWCKVHTCPRWWT